MNNECRTLFVNVWIRLSKHCLCKYVEPRKPLGVTDHAIKERIHVYTITHSRAWPGVNTLSIGIYCRKVNKYGVFFLPVFITRPLSALHYLSMAIRFDESLSFMAAPIRHSNVEFVNSYLTIFPRYQRRGDWHQWRTRPR